MKRSLLVCSVLLGALVACEGFKEAMTAHVDVVAKAGSQELSVDRLSALLGQVKVPVTPDIAKAVTQMWVNYQLLGQAAAHDDSLKDPKLLDTALWPIISQGRIAKFQETVAKSTPGIDTSGGEAKYARGDVLAARHILFVIPPNATPGVKDSVRKHAESIRAQVTSANFADMAKKNSQDPGSAQRGGDLGVFPKGVMVKEFADAVSALKPGEISPQLVQTQFGYHIIRRSTYPEVKAQFDQAANSTALRAADSAYVSKVESAADIKIKDNAPATLRAAAKDLDAHANDNTVLATSKLGDFTVARLVRWVGSHPDRPQIEQGMGQAPDSVVVGFVRSLVRTELLLSKADSAKVSLDTAEVTQLHNRFAGLIGTLWDQLGVTPKSLSDSAKTESQRERVAASDVDQYMDKLMVQQARFVQVPPPVEAILHQKYAVKVNQAGIDRALERAQKAKATADSTRAKNRPPTEVPLGPAPSKQPQPTQPGKATPAKTDTSKKP